MPSSGPLAGSRRIGVDIGKVLCGGDTDQAAGTPTMFGPDFLLTPEIEGGVDAVAALIATGHAVHLVSKCGPGVQRKTEMWLDARDVFTRTGLPAENVHFVRQRPDKAPVADRLGLDAFVDDRLDVLTTLRAGVRTRVLFGPQPVALKLPGGVVRALGWREVLAILRR